MPSDGVVLLDNNRQKLTNIVGDTLMKCGLSLNANKTQVTMIGQKADTVSILRCSSINAARRYDDGCNVSRPLLLVACTFMARDADATTACSSAVSTDVGVL